MTNPLPPNVSVAIRAREAFLAIADAPVRERAGMLMELHAEDPTVAETVEAMLEGDAAADAPGELSLSEPLIDLQAIFADAGDDRGSLPDLGPRYAVRQLIGCGSAGDVYLARQQAPIERDVAIKIFRPFRVGTVRRQRFDTEAKALASLEHPGIARIFDTGTAPDGRPFLVMEFAPGLAIDEACREADLDMHARLAVLAQLCHIVHHAHQRGVIHRDLKPRNILAELSETKHSIKVIDFGLARLAEEAGLPARQRTMTGQVLGTLDYMSPEQLRGEQRFDARSDVYALGVIFFEVLTGRLPLCGGAAAHPGPKAPMALAMPEVPARYRRDVQTVAGRALAHDANDRFPSAEHLADEIHRILEGVPILTRRTSLPERIVRAIRRSPLTAVATALLITLGVALLTTVLVYQSLRATDAAQQLNTIEQMLDGVLEELEHMSGTAAVRRAVVPPLLEHARELRSNRRRDPNTTKLLARILVLHGNQLADMESSASALTAFEEAASLFMALSNTALDSVETRRRAAVAIIRCGDMHGLSDVAKMRRSYTQALELHEALAAEYPEHLGVLDDRSWSYHRIGIDFLRAEDYDAAAEFLTRRYDSARELLDLDRNRNLSLFNLMSAYLGLGSLAHRQSDPETAVEQLRNALDISRTLLLDEPELVHYATTTLIALDGMARAAANLGDNALVCEAIDSAVPLMQRLLQENPDNQFYAGNAFWTSLSLGESALRLKETERAELMLQTARRTLPMTPIVLAGELRERWDALEKGVATLLEEPLPDE